jgi:hypothetical protein
MVRPNRPIYMGIINPHGGKVHKRMTRTKYLHIPDNYPHSGPAYVRVPANGAELQKRIGKKNLIEKFSKKLSVQEIERKAPGIIAEFTDLIDDGGDASFVAKARAQLFAAAEFATSVQFVDEFETKLLPVLTARQHFQRWLDGDATNAAPACAGVGSAAEIVPPCEPSSP